MGPRDRRIVIEVHREAPDRPAFGQPCNGCGQCCLAEPCPLGMLVSRRRHGACAALCWHPGAAQYRCGLLEDPAALLGPRWRWLASRLRPWLVRCIRRWIAAGAGCDARFEDGSGSA
ncbi:MAG: hypothetical protein JOY84_07430 [Curvibacter sp.]|nr:hypothetical protein [Curvibacter sp.]